ncbi:LppX_LprAFG lipoprotein [Streptosporangiaceae bacterium NEAU-GS5]|nr:LppX_LprAFG lipoprotein [Streptosporangiaceae bacterium NEAU-GS5]
MTKAHLALAAISATTALGLFTPAKTMATPMPTPTPMDSNYDMVPESPSDTDGTSEEPTDTEGTPEESADTGEPSESGEASESPPAEGSEVPEAFRKAVTKSMTTSSSGTIDFSAEKKGGDKPGSVKAKISYSYQPKPHPAGTFKIMDLTVNGTPKNSSPQVMLDNETVYVKPSGLFPTVQGKDWWKISLSKVPGGSDFVKKLSDPNLPQKVLSAYKDVKVVGKETVDGVAVTHYTGKLDVAAMDKALGVSDKYASQIPEDPTFEAWVDAQDYVRRSKVQGESDKGSAMWTTNVREYGRPVTIQTPPAGEVSELNLDQLKKGGSPAASPTSS